MAEPEADLTHGLLSESCFVLAVIGGYAWPAIVASASRFPRHQAAGPKACCSRYFAGSGTADRSHQQCLRILYATAGAMSNDQSDFQRGTEGFRWHGEARHGRGLDTSSISTTRESLRSSLLRIWRSWKLSSAVETSRPLGRPWRKSSAKERSLGIRPRPNSGSDKWR